jgi:ligand-binding sensor domain-containing protein
VAVYRPRTNRPYILVGTDIGVYLSRDRGASWEKYGAGLPRAVVMDLVVDAERHRVVASTLGRGMWTAVLPAEP